MIDYIKVNSVDDLPNFDTTLPIFADIETDDLYGPLRMIQFYQPQTSDSVYIVDIAPIGYDKKVYEEEYQKLRSYILLHYTVWYNSSYDLGTMNISPALEAYGPKDISKYTEFKENKVDDLYYAVKIAYANLQEFGLKKIVKRIRYLSDYYTDIDTDETVKRFIRGAYISEKSYKYGALDVFILSKLWEDKKIQNVIQNNLAYKVDMISQAYALIYQQNGLILDREAWKRELSDAYEREAKYMQLLPDGFNPNSFKQVRAYLETDQSDHNALIAYSMSDRAKAASAIHIIELKKAKKQISYLNSINFDKMYTKFNVYGAVTGRFTASGGCLDTHFNAQQIPRNYQYMFNNHTPDTSVVHADYATLELRLAAAIYGEPNMYKQLKDGEDLHSSMAMQVSGKKLSSDGILDWNTKSDEFITAKDRHEAKGANFGFVFGMSANTFVGYAYTGYGVSYTEEEAKDVRHKYFSLYPTIGKYHDNVWSNYKKPDFYVYTALGRIVKPKLGTDGINTPVQGSGAETTKLAVHYLVKDYSPEALKYIYNVVHDAIYLRIPKGEEDYWSEALESSMKKAWTEISKTQLFKFKDIPIIADVEVH